MLESNPASQEIDVEVLALAGEGSKNGQLWIGGGTIPKENIPKLSQLRASRTRSQPDIVLPTARVANDSTISCLFYFIDIPRDGFFAL